MTFIKENKKRENSDVSEDDGAQKKCQYNTEKFHEEFSSKRNSNLSNSIGWRKKGRSNKFSQKR